MEETYGIHPAPRVTADDRLITEDGQEFDTLEEYFDHVEASCATNSIGHVVVDVDDA